MYLDKRSKEILEELINHPNLSSKDIETKTGLSRRQIKYSVEKINNWLKENNYPVLQRLKNGKFLIDPVLGELYDQDQLRVVDNYIPSENERVLLILLILLSQHDLSLVHFTQALKVSNVTILSDMKKAQQKIEPFHLQIVYSRTEGYQLTGDEWELRNLLYYLLQDLSRRYGGLAMVQDFAMLDGKKTNHLFNQLEKIEEYLGTKFSDERIQLLPYCIGIILQRIERGNIIHFDFQIQYNELSDTKEYTATEFLISEENNFPKVERLYITLQLLSTNVFSSDVLRENEIPQLKQALTDTLLHFEENAFIKLKNKDYLINKLMLHLKPAYYRIKYNLTSFQEATVKLDRAYKELDHLVEVSLQPLEAFMNCTFPINERMYITLFIGGHLIETKQALPERKKAIIVCRNGVTISKLLQNTLTELFPEIEFKQTMSMRKFNEVKPADIDVVFTPEPMQTSVPLFITHAFLSNSEKRQLRQRVMKSLYEFDYENLDIQGLVTIIEKSANIHNKDKLIADIQEFCFPNKKNNLLKPQLIDPGLDELLHQETIQIVDQVTNWQEAIWLAAKPLLKSEAIEESYVYKMLASHDFNSPYMILGKSMAIPHAAPEDGVNKLSMSMLVVKEGVLFSKELGIHFIVVIAPTDANQHVKAIYQLSNLADNEEKLSNILAAEDQETVIRILKET